MADDSAAHAARLALTVILLAATFVSAVFGTVALTIAFATATVGTMLLAVTVAVTSAIARAAAVGGEEEGGA